jgi:hypothetical protein
MSQRARVLSGVVFVRTFIYDEIFTCTQNNVSFSVTLFLNFTCETRKKILTCIVLSSIIFYIELC